MKFLPLITALLLSSTAHAGVIDQRDPNFQEGVEHLARARQALEVAMTELRAADAVYEFPGMNIVNHLGQITPVTETLDLMLFPEKRRLETKVLTPDSIFFNPVPLKED